MTRSPAALGLDVKRLQARHHRAIDAALAPLGASLVQWDALRHLHENPDASLHELAGLTFQSDQAFGTLARRMAERGLLERRAGPGRTVRLRATEQGERVRVAAQARVDDVLRASFGRLSTDELAQLDALLTKLLG